MHVRLIPHSPSGPRHLLAHYPLVSCILALLAIYTDARAYRPSASLLAFLAGRVWTRHGSSTIAPPAFLYCWALPAGRANRDASHPTPRLADTVADAPPPTDANDHACSPTPSPTHRLRPTPTTTALLPTNSQQQPSQPPSHLTPRLADTAAESVQAYLTHVLSTRPKTVPTL